MPKPRKVAPVQTSVCDLGLLSIVDAGKFIGASRTVMFEMLKRGEIPFVRVHGRRRVPVRALIQYAERNLVERAS